VEHPVISAVLGVAAATLMLAVVLPAASPRAALAAGQATATTVAAVTIAGHAGDVRHARPAAPASATRWRQLGYGSRGRDVRALQRRLTVLKYYPGAANGLFGANTLEAVWAFQEVQGLAVTGVVGPATARALRHPRGYRSRYSFGHPTRVEVNLAARVLVVYRHHRVALISHISAGGGYYYDGGARAITPTGRFRTTAYYRGWIRVPLGAMYNLVFFIRTAYAIHGEPTYGPYGGGVPLNPVSHGCVRIPYDIAWFFHTLVRTPGTPVYVYY
jgi:peptidoglycan hydrolase-like protein with peptidoglycan-binding domain